MAHKVMDRARETSTTTGTGTYSLDGPILGFQDFDADMATGDTTFAFMQMGSDWEVGFYTFTSGSPDTLARTSIFQSSNGDAAVNWGAGTKEITGCIPASALQFLAHSVLAKAGFSELIIPPQGRLCLATGTPVHTTTIAAQIGIFYTPYVGRTIPLYDGVRFAPIVFSELSTTTTDTTKSPAAIGASKVNDWFVWDDAGTLRLSHGPDWTDDTTRSAGTALVRVNGIWLNSVAITNGPGASRGTYVGTTRSDSSSQLNFILGGSASGGTAGLLGVWNAYNRVDVGVDVIDTGIGYTYTSATIRQARASAGNQISFVTGLAEDACWAAYCQRVDTAAAANASVAVGLGFDSTTTYSGQRGVVHANSAAVQIGAAAVSKSFAPALGYHIISGNENSDGTNANTFDNGATGTLSGLFRM